MNRDHNGDVRRRWGLTLLLLVVAAVAGAGWWVVVNSAVDMAAKQAPEAHYVDPAEQLAAEQARLINCGQVREAHDVMNRILRLHYHTNWAMFSVGVQATAEARLSGADRVVLLRSWAISAPSARQRELAWFVYAEAPQATHDHSDAEAEKRLWEFIRAYRSGFWVVEAYIALALSEVAVHQDTREAEKIAWRGLAAGPTRYQQSQLVAYINMPRHP